MTVTRCILLCMPKKAKVLVEFGNAVHKYRTARGWTQEELAEKADVHWSYISKIECGERNTSLKMIDKLADTFGITRSQLCRDIT